jgi:hypothetical protein
MAVYRIPKGTVGVVCKGKRKKPPAEGAGWRTHAATRDVLVHELVRCGKQVAFRVGCWWMKVAASAVKRGVQKGTGRGRPVTLQGLFPAKPQASPPAGAGPVVAPGEGVDEWRDQD